MAWRVRGPLGPPFVDRAFLREVARAAFRECAAFARVAGPVPLRLFLAPVEAKAARGDQERVPRRSARHDRRLRRAFPRGPCRSTSPPDRAPWIPHRGQRSRLRYIWKLPL